MEPSVPQYTHHEEGYGKNAAEQKAIAVLVLPAFMEALGGVNVSGIETFTVCDYGAADGMNSVTFIKACRDHLDAVCGNCDLLWVFNDLQNNNYNGLFKNIKDISIEGAENIFLTATSGSFYKQVMPNKSVDFGLCLTAVHWLSESLYTSMNKDVQLQHAKELGKKDWMSFLLNRAKEMKPGSQLVLTVPRDEHDVKGLHFSVGALLAIRNLYERNIITQEEFQVMTAARVLHRNEEDIRAPFEAGANYAATKAGLRLVKIERCTHDFSFFAELQPYGTRKDEVTRETGVKKMISFLKTFSVTYLSILSKTRQKDEERAINQVFFHEIENVVRENLEKFQTDFPYLIVQIEKCV